MLRLMGQSVNVVRKKSSNPEVVRFEINRSLTGMGHERYPTRESANGVRPPDELARSKAPLALVMRSARL